VHVGAIEDGSRFTYADSHYFATMGISLLSGRGFTDADTNKAPLVLIVNQAFIRKFIGTAEPIGQLVHVMPEPQYPARTYQIVGTIPDTKYNDLRADTEPIAFVPAAQLPVEAQGPWAAVMIASNTGPGVVTAVRRTLESKYPGAILRFADFQQGIKDNLVGDRMMAMLSGFFGLLAAVLVVVGLYGVLSYFITRRRNEIGIRIALGARRGQVIALVMRDTAAMLLIGLVLGTALTLLAGRAATAMLFGLKPYDFATLAFATMLLAIIAVLATWLPAVKASKLDPVAALRSE
jgi:ABC-type antimicrobial peptide transport system permease subunit